MRVISGTARSRKLKELVGTDTRPTTDNVKESMFNIVQFDIEGRKVLDLFAGTGQLGIECLSRGASACTFVDLRKEAVALVRDNLTLCGLAENATVIQGDYLSYLARGGVKYDLIFMDPPYNTGLLEKAIEAVVGFDILSEHGIMICESPKELVLPEVKLPYEVKKEYRYGKIKLTVYRRNNEE